MTNTKLLTSGVTTDDFIALGFKEENDGSDSPWGIDWNFRNEKFHIIIDCTFEVKMCRLDVNSDYIVVQVDDLYDLENLLAFVL